MLVLPKLSVLKFPLYFELASYWGSKHIKLKFWCKRKKPNYISHDTIVGDTQSQSSSPLKKTQTKLYQLSGWGLLRFINSATKMTILLWQNEYQASGLHITGLSYSFLYHSLCTSLVILISHPSSTDVLAVLQGRCHFVMFTGVFFKAPQRITLSTVLQLSLLLSPQRGRWMMIPLAVRV